jgi:hypothetical protein
MLSRRAARTAVQAFVLVALLGSWPASVAATSGPAKVASQPSSRALCPPATPGYMTCDSLISTAVAPLAKAAVGPNFTPNGYGPADLLSAYALPDQSSGEGTGMTVAVVDAFDLASAEADLATYRSQFGLSACTTANGCFTKVDQNGGTNYPVTNAGWNGETALDIEMVSAICPNCRIILVEANSSSGDDLFTAEAEAVALGARVISNSWGGSEGFGEQDLDEPYFDQPGIAITFSTGDNGYGTQYPAASPFVTAVGGTSLTHAANPRGWTETAWGSAGGGNGAGSGCSSIEAKPTFQHDSGCTMRTIADVSADADPATGVAVYSASLGGWVKFGGTSVASPIIAGVYALAGPASPGTYPVSYPYAKPGQLNDVTSGANGSCGGTYLCTGKTGYDGPTGLGTPIGTGAFGTGSAPSAPNSVVATAGNASASVTWHAAAPNGHPVTGYTVTSTPGSQTCTTSGALTCVVGGLTNGTSYTFKVKATNSAGTGSASAASNAVIPATVPGPPTGVSATPADGAAQVSWLAPASNGGKAITGYTVTASPGGRTCSASAALTCSVMLLANGTSYAFTVIATNPIGPSAPSAASSGITPITVPGATYYVIPPTRFVDSRKGQGGVTKLLANVHQTFQVTNLDPGGASNIPLNAVAVTGNLTVTGQTAAGYLSLTTVPDNAPGTSTINFPVGDVRANGVAAPLGAGGTLNVTYVGEAGSSAQVVFDVTGYFASDAGGATYKAVAPTRLVDSRRASQPLTSLVANVAQTLQVADLSPSDTTTPVLFGAIAVTGNLAVTGQTSAGFISLTTVADNAPATSTLNFPAGDTRANGVTVPLGPGGTLGITYVAKPGARADVVFDVTGYFVNDATGATYIPVTPNRLVDSRQPGSVTKLFTNVAQTFDVANKATTIAANIPADAIAVTGNLTVTGQTAAGYFSLTTVADNNPATSTLNFPVGDVRANGVTITLGSGQTLSVTYVAKGGATAQVVFDVTGYFVP